MRRRRFYVELTLGAASGLLLTLTLLWKDWIELAFHVDPDEGSGTLEWGLAGAQLAFTILFAALAAVEFRRTLAA